MTKELQLIALGSNEEIRILPSTSFVKLTLEMDKSRLDCCPLATATSLPFLLIFRPGKKSFSCFFDTTLISSQTSLYL